MGNKLLIVDDELIIRQMLADVFSRLGYEVYTAESAEEALTILANTHIKVMFFDIQLPGMSGLDLCRQVRQTNRIAVIYAITGFTNLFQLDECREVGFDDYFSKPFQIVALVKATQEAFEKIDRWTRK